MTCPMTLQNLQKGGPPYNYKNGVCLQTGGSRYWTANQCFALALGLQADPTPCEQFEFEFPNKTTALIDPLFFYNQGADTLNYYYNFDNQTLVRVFICNVLAPYRYVVTQQLTYSCEHLPLSLLIFYFMYLDE